ncbi:MAG TPA: hypothetical protein VGL37_03905 [Solirubrobacteraceae bacterium]
MLSTAWPWSSIATQSALDAQETETSGGEAIATGVDQALGSDTAGVVLKSSCPCSSTATQKAFDGQEIALSGVVPSIVTGDHDPTPTEGLTPTNARPSPSTATHSAVEGHEIERSTLPPSIASGDQDHVLPVLARAPITARPASSTTTQRVAEGHEIPVGLWAPSASIGTDHESEGAAAAALAEAARQPTQMSSPSIVRRAAYGECESTR